MLVRMFFIEMRDRRDGIHSSVSREVNSVFKGKTLNQLNLLQDQIRSKVKGWLVLLTDNHVYQTDNMTRNNILCMSLKNQSRVYNGTELPSNVLIIIVSCIHSPHVRLSMANSGG